MITLRHLSTRVPTNQFQPGFANLSAAAVATCFALLVVIAPAAAQTRHARNFRPGRHAADRIDMSAARPVASRSRSRDRVMQAAETSYASGEIQQVGLFDGCEASCGMEATCGCETVCDCPIGSYVEPGCGSETWCEPGCGCETVGCDGMACQTGCDGSRNCGCGNCSGGFAQSIGCLFPRLSMNWKRLDVSVGVAGFTGPMNFANRSAVGTDRVGTGSFGFYQALNKGHSLQLLGNDLGVQTGVRFLQANLSGAGFSTETRQQVYVTTGLFRRVDYGLQFGLVVDYQYEDWYYRGNLMQLRGEFSWMNCNRTSYGFRYAARVKNDRAVTSVVNNLGVIVQNEVSFRPTNHYRFFLRKELARYGGCEAFGGWTNSRDGIFGVNANYPIVRCVMLDTSMTYLIPRQDRDTTGHIEEGWNLAMGFTIRPWGHGSQNRNHRPLFSVADNGTFMVDRAD